MVGSTQLALATSSASGQRGIDFAGSISFDHATNFMLIGLSYKQKQGNEMAKYAFDVWREVDPNGASIRMKLVAYQTIGIGASKTGSSLTEAHKVASAR